MVKPYLNKSCLLLVFLWSLLAIPVEAASDYGHFFVKITDATTALEAGETDQVEALLTEIRTEFEGLEEADSKAGKKVKETLSISGEVTKDDLVEVTAALIAFDEEQHPIDVEAEKKKLLTRLTPEYEAFQQALDSQEIEAVKAAYKKLNTTWTLNEGIVRKESAHYGRVETSISFLRSAIETEPVDFAMIQSNFESMKAAIQDFLDGKDVAGSETNASLSDGIHLLEEALDAFQSGDNPAGSAKMKEFITLWPSIEGDISTRNPALYNRVESTSPIIMVKGAEASYQEQLETMIADLSAIDISASYHFMDAALILLREGLEALLILLALTSSLKASKQKKGLPWVYGGAIAGVVASILTALILQLAVPSLTSGANREIIEGLVGIVAVVMMFFIGIWLHSKSSVKKWNAYMDKQMRLAMTTGSFVSMFSLSFLAVFREGAETILFYVGILPRISQEQLLLGIGLAVVTLIGTALLLTRLTNRMVAYKLFFWMTWLIYALAFKMLGVSIHALQLTSVLPSHLIDGLPPLDWIGFYPTWEGLIPQAIFVLLVIWISLKNREPHDG